jgi:hypothetical protein
MRGSVPKWSAAKAAAQQGTAAVKLKEPRARRTKS